MSTFRAGFGNFHKKEYKKPLTISIRSAEHMPLWRLNSLHASAHPARILYSTTEMISGIE